LNPDSEGPESEQTIRFTLTWPSGLYSLHWSGGKSQHRCKLVKRI
jgi:hypothetical protein